MKKELITAILVTLVVSGLIGFYGGRFFERNTQRKRFENIRQTMEQRQSTSSTGGTRRFDGQGPRNFDTIPPRN